MPTLTMTAQPGAKLPRMQGIIAGRESDPYYKWIRELFVRENIGISVLSIGWTQVDLLNPIER